MTVVDLIEQIRSLDPQDRAKVMAALLEIEAAQGISPMDDQVFDRAANRVVERHAETLRKLAQ